MPTSEIWPVALLPHRFNLMKQFPEADFSEEMLQAPLLEYQPATEEPVKRRRRRKQNIAAELGGNSNGYIIYDYLNTMQTCTAPIFRHNNPPQLKQIYPGSSHPQSHAQQASPTADSSHPDFTALLMQYNVKPAAYRFVVSLPDREAVDALKVEKQVFLHHLYRNYTGKGRYMCKVAGRWQCRYHFYALRAEDGSYHVFESADGHQHVQRAEKRSQKVIKSVRDVRQGMHTA